MLAINPTGIASVMVPSAVLKGTGTYTFKVYLMDGVMPAKEILQPIMSEVEFNTLFADSIIGKFTSISFNTSFDNTIQQRVYNKTPVDALPFTPLKSGTIGWFMMVTTGEKMMFCDSIGNWDDVDTNMTVSDIVCVQDQENILKDINFIIRDKSTYEIKPLGIFQPAV